jgi:hypothetical protein
MSSDEYEHVLDIIRGMATVMERSPKAFRTLGEDDLRTHLLARLNDQYEGTATGETFNLRVRPTSSYAIGAGRSSLVSASSGGDPRRSVPRLTSCSATRAGATPRRQSSSSIGPGS